MSSDPSTADFYDLPFRSWETRGSGGTSQKMQEISEIGIVKNEKYISKLQSR